jgi:hypothetical protein
MLHVALTATLAAVVLVAAALVGSGAVKVRRGGDNTPPAREQPARAQAADTGQPSAPSRPMIEEVKKTPIAFKYTDKEDSALDFRLFRYTGTWIDCWQESEIDGKWVVTHEILGKDLKEGFGEHLRKALAEAFEEGKAGEKSQPPDPPLFGYLAWGRRISKGNDEVMCELLLTAGGENGQSRSRGMSIGGILRLAREEGKTTGHSWFGRGVSLPSALEGEVTLLDGVITLHQGDKKAERRVRLKCRPWSPDGEVKK